MRSVYKFLSCYFLSIKCIFIPLFVKILFVADANFVSFIPVQGIPSSYIFFSFLTISYVDMFFIFVLIFLYQFRVQYIREEKSNRFKCSVYWYAFIVLFSYFTHDKYIIINEYWILSMYEYKRKKKKIQVFFFMQSNVIFVLNGGFFF